MNPATTGPAESEPTPTGEAVEQPHAYTLWAVLRRDPHGDSAAAPADAVAELDQALTATPGVTVRGLYDVSGFKADSDAMIWLHGPRAEDLQAALRTLRRTALLRPLLPTFNMMGIHREAEFNARHVPAFLRGKEPQQWLTIYPFVRSYEWYLLPEEERRAMLADHGRRGAAFRGVLANTVAAFSLGDYEWVLALEAEELTELVDLMRDLRYTEARRHVREEVPFYTGRRISAAELAEVLS
ncbi:hydrogen peroxide-dependent heme synthase [Ruania halotolerans]|uniref:hydrogen peroxide-dependent heme synthase n=1 Tax=Ruania halotolerans TaxID=2897773 RepID=UPI001E470E54|nr:hydrogen peroxide-dependent heme synthase [Ruania halotolerans]UFU07781.1 chlorite dismutase family protein [Ruania halotolerans]